jgi:hypothetical protein
VLLISHPNNLLIKRFFVFLAKINSEKYQSRMRNILKTFPSHLLLVLKTPLQLEIASKEHQPRPRRKEATFPSTPKIALSYKVSMNKLDQAFGAQIKKKP